MKTVDVDGARVIVLGSNLDCSVSDVEGVIRELDRCALCVYYEVDEFPRYRVSMSDDVCFALSDVPVVLSDASCWFGSISSVDALFVLVCHDFQTPEEFMEWERVNLSSLFMRVNNCGFVVKLL